VLVGLIAGWLARSCKAPASVFGIVGDLLIGFIGN
jgi:uncharacterized membrane protein YeaQ/YmgE (transglycosylase-associated protein family)